MNFQEIKNPYISKEEIDRLLEIATNNPMYTKSGGNNKCFVIDDYAVLKTSNIEGHTENFDKIIEDIYELKNMGVNVTPILGYAIVQYGTPYYNGARYDSGFIIQERAKGQELLNYHDTPRSSSTNTQENRDKVLNYCQMLYNAPQEHFDKFVADYKMITDKKISIDASKLTNFFYDHDKGFSFIDMNFYSNENEFDKLDVEGNSSHRLFICHILSLTNRIPLQSYEGIPYYSPEECEFIKMSMCSVVQKMQQSLLKIGVSEQDIQNVFKEPQSSKGTDVVFRLFDFKDMGEILDYANQSTM